MKEAAESATRASVLEQIKTVVGDRGWSDDPHDMAPSLVDQRGRYRGRSPLLVKPATTEEVAQVVRRCNEAGVGVVPQGGNTGLVGGSVPDASGDQIVLSLSRMQRVRDLDALDFTVTVEAGCVLATLKSTVEEAGLLFPLGLASEGTCQIGGNLATNAGGTAVLRYGNARDLVLGLEVVLASGEVWNGLRRLRKDNSGYDIARLFLGAEGTLGIITAAVLKLFPRPVQVQTALVAVSSPDAALRLLASCRGASGDCVTTFEYIDRACVDIALAELEGLRDPLAERHQHYVLVELTSARAGGNLRQALEHSLQAGMGSGEVRDAVLAETGEQSRSLWALRECIPEALRKVGLGIKHDVSVPVSRVPVFLERAREVVARTHRAATVVAFGHLGDGNIHFNLSRPEGVSEDEFFAPEARVQQAVFDLVHALDGSFSAEHGVGQLRRAELLRYKSQTEIGIMRALKQALDPNNTLNPGKIL